MPTERDTNRRRYIDREIKKEEQWRKDKLVIVFSLILAIVTMGVMNVYLMSAR